VRTTISTLALCAASLIGSGLASAQQQRHPDLPSGLRFEHRRVSSAHGGFDLDAVAVDLCDATVVPRVSAPGEGRRTVSAWAREVGAVVAVNGDYFDSRTMLPLGPARGAGHDWIERRHEHRDALLAFDTDARPHLLDAPDSPQPALWTDAGSRLESGWPDEIAVRERVLRDGVVRESPAIEHDGERHPRTALALSADQRTMWFVVVDGRTEHSSGATTDELAQALVQLGAREGMKLDGGGSSTLYVRGLGVVNHPSDGHERVVANHVGIVLSPSASGRRAWCATPVVQTAAAP
jgi:hypothetical protein